MMSAPPGKLLPHILLASAMAWGVLGQRIPGAPNPQHQDSITRELALATFDTAWTRIRDLHYDPRMNGVDWNGVRTALRPQAESAGTLTRLREVLRDMLSRLGESHYTLIPREAAEAFTTDQNADVSGVPGDIGIEVRLASDESGLFLSSVDSGSPAALAGLRTGWKVMQVGEMDVESALTAIDTLESSRARREGLLRLVLRVQAATRGIAGEDVTVRMVDERGSERSQALKLRPTPGEPVKIGNLPVNMARISWRKLTASSATAGATCTGVLKFSTWAPALSPAIDNAVDSLRSCGAMVVDMRGNTGGVANMVVGTAGHFLTTPDTLGWMKTRSVQLSFAANPRIVTADGRRVQPFQGKVAILVDEITASTSEIFAGAMQSLGRARVFGDTTAGQALPATLHRLPTKDVLMVVVADFRGPRGERIEGRGIVPQVVVPRSRAGLLASRDAVMDAALEWLARSQEF